MQELCIEPLRKHKSTGERYTRRSPIIDFIERSRAWPLADLLQRAAIRDRRGSDYVPSEVLVYYLRSTKADNSDSRFVAIYNILRDRIQAACPRPNRQIAERTFEDARIAEIRKWQCLQLTKRGIDRKRARLHGLEELPQTRCIHGTGM